MRQSKNASSCISFFFIAGAWACAGAFQSICTPLRVHQPLHFCLHRLEKPSWYAQLCLSTITLRSAWLRHNSNVPPRGKGRERTGPWQENNYRQWRSARGFPPTRPSSGLSISQPSCLMLLRRYLLCGERINGAGWSYWVARLFQCH